MRQIGAILLLLLTACSPVMIEEVVEVVGEPTAVAEEPYA